ncbi:ARHGAP17 [Lepeophtheirus salmonis]|uniref:ARHGAP17 n=1 Tax=Lepeophtheirus salmonis TaxID=72036 RepID=A0A0K2TWV5_LEPSM|nr:rho GTPase-activating protein 17-like [Lepeophtheirus salmonis]CAB4057137.1 ARHGAP17 [Lepeophtheirus salmonis]CAF2811256.1 ARHGAP17 [Lepeophtheirus salmonis]
MKKSIEKLKVRIDQNLNRAEKTELLNEDLLRIEEKVLGLKQVCQSVTKKLSEGNNKGTDGAAIEKRIRKTTDFIVGQTIQENGRLFTRKDETSFLGTLLSESGHLLNNLAANQIQYEIEVEKLVIQQLTSILDNHWPLIMKEKRNLERCVSDLDRIKSRLLHVKNSNASVSASSSSTSTGGGSGGSTEDSAALQRELNLQEELYEVQNKVDSSRDGLASLMLQFLAKEPEIGRILLTYFKVKKEYHAHVAEQISQQASRFSSLIDTSSIPVYGEDIKVHLNKSGRIIAIPLQLCVCRLIQLGLEEEGLFRVAASAGKIKHLKAIFDAGEWGRNTLLQIEDHHVFAGALKTYLRDLPSPLLDGNYESWLEHGKRSEQQQNPSLKDLVSKLPRENRENLNYLFQFCNFIASKSSENKMTISNLSIVLAPNLLWQPEELHPITSSSSINGISNSQFVNTVVANLIENVDYYFENPDVDFFDGVLISGSSVSMSERLCQHALRTPVTSRANISGLVQHNVSNHSNSSSTSNAHSNHNTNSSSITRAPVPTPRGSKHGNNGNVSVSNHHHLYQSNISSSTNKPVIPAKPNIDSIKSVQQDLANIKISAESTNL